MRITTISAQYLRLRLFFRCSENRSDAEKFHMILYKIEHGDISFLFHKLKVNT